MHNGRYGSGVFPDSIGREAGLGGQPIRLAIRWSGLPDGPVRTRKIKNILGFHADFLFTTNV